MAGWRGVVQVVGVVASGWVGGELVERGGAGGGGYKYICRVDEESKGRVCFGCMHNKEYRI